jgi:hypothetical protein
MEHFLPSGKFRGCVPRSVPKDYLDWFPRNCKPSSGLRAAIRAELVRRGTHPSRLPPDLPPHIKAAVLALVGTAPHP